MACYECHHCGQCEVGRIVPVEAGYCPVCKTSNEADAVKCAGCGMVLPKPPKIAPNAAMGATASRTGA